MSEGSEETKTKLDSSGESSDVDNENCISSGGGSSGEAKRTCVDCGTFRTPLWRGGPAGPKVRTTLYSLTFQSSGSEDH